MPSLRRVSGWEVVEALQRLGFAPVHQHGSHIVLKRQTPQGDIGCVVPLHRELAIGTLRAVLRQARETPEEFMEKLQQIGDQTPMFVGGWMLPHCGFASGGVWGGLWVTRHRDWGTRPLPPGVDPSINSFSGSV